MTGRHDEEVSRAGLTHDFEHDIIAAPAEELMGTWLRFMSRDRAIKGEVVEVYDDPSGTRRILLESESGVVKAIPLWNFDGAWKGWEFDDE